MLVRLFCKYSLIASLIWSVSVDCCKKFWFELVEGCSAIGASVVLRSLKLNQLPFCCGMLISWLEVPWVWLTCCSATFSMLGAVGASGLAKIKLTKKLTKSVVIESTAPDCFEKFALFSFFLKKRSIFYCSFVFLFV